MSDGLHELRIRFVLLRLMKRIRVCGEYVLFPEYGYSKAC